MMRKWILGGAIAVLCLSAQAVEMLDVADMKTWRIVVAPDAIASERYAAQEFQSLFKDALGMELPIENSAASATGNVYIGPGAIPEKGYEAFKLDELGKEGVYVDIRRNNMALAGGRTRGTLYAVYELFERFCGVRFLTYDHTHFPERDVPPSLRCEVYTYVPPLSFRWSYYRENATHPEFAARLHCNTVTNDEKLGGSTPQKLIGHSYYWQVPYKVYGEEHPEYFALHDGRRVTSGYGGPQICPTDPEVVDIVTQAVLDRLAEHPETKNIAVSQNDNEDYCQCPRCQAINDREESGMGAHLTLVNTVAERVAEKHPDVMIGTLAYQYTRKPPKHLRPRDNVQIQLCSIECCTVHPVNDPKCEKNHSFCKDLNGWKEISDNVWIWHYNTDFFNYDLPFPNLRAIGENVRFFTESHAKGIFMQANAVSLSGEMSDLRNYVMSRCLWTPGLDSWELVEEFCHLHYKEAAEPILTYLTELHDNAEKMDVHPDCFPTAAEVGLTPTMANRTMECFDAAMKAAQSDTIRKRVEKASICAYKALIATHSDLHYKDGVCKLNLPDGLVEHYLSLFDRYQLTSVNETRPLSEFVDDLKKMSAGMPALRLENDLWAVTVIPELNGRVAELIYKPNGRNFLFGRNRTFFRQRGLEEWGRENYDENNPRAFTGKLEGNTVYLSKELPDGSLMTRTITFAENKEDGVRFETTIKNNTDAEKTFQWCTHPEYDTLTQTDDEKEIGVYLHGATWTQANRDFDFYEGQDEEKLKDFSGGEYAIFNHKEGYGAVQRFNPDDFTLVSIYWSPDRYQLNLEMDTVPVTLQAGESKTIGYNIAYLEKAPM